MRSRLVRWGWEGGASVSVTASQVADLVSQRKRQKKMHASQASKSILFAFLVVLTVSLCSAADVHTWHNVTGHGTDEWHARLAIITADESGYFTDDRGVSQGPVYDFDVHPGTVARFGFGFDIFHANFDIAYTLAAYTKGGDAEFDTPACVYVVSAKSPKNPDIRTETYGGTTCSWHVVNNVGENFVLGA